MLIIPTGPKIIPNNLLPVTEFIAGGDLHHLWKETGYFEEELIQVYCGELALALGKSLKSNYFY